MHLCYTLAVLLRTIFNMSNVVPNLEQSDTLWFMGPFILTGCRSKSSLIESVSCSSKIIPPELSQDSDSSSNINWMKEQRADPNLTVIIKLIESGQLQK